MTDDEWAEELRLHPATDEDYWRAKFCNAVNSAMEEDSDWGQMNRDAVRHVTGQDGPIS